MTKTLLAVDDSVTMRKVLEITFSGEDYRVVTAETAQEATSKLGENPHVCVIDTSLGSDDGYALAKEVRKRNPGAAIILLASRYAPYDQAKGKDAGADDWADKPFDTQQLIDKVRKAMTAKEAGGASAAPVAAAPAAAPPAQPPMPQPMPARSPLQVPSAAAAAPAASGIGGSFGIGRGTQPSLSASVPKTNLEPAPAPMPARAAATADPAPMAAAPAAAAPAVSAAVNGQLAGKLGDLGLTKDQADAVLALSREVVERVVWEVVPQLAEAIIKEEIARLTRE